MDNKNDWEELEKWNANRIQTEKEKFGIDYEKLNANVKTKNVDRFVKGLKITGNISKVFAFILFAIVTFIIIIVLDLIFSNMKSKTNVDVVKTIENMYQTKVNIISKNIDEKENGTYKLEVKQNNEIQFNAIRKYGSLTEDYSDNCHKYYFNKWDNTKKRNFIINENITGEILDFDTYIEIHNYNELEEGMKLINEFVDFCGEEFSPNWRIYLKKGDYSIYPYQQSGMSKEDATNKAKELYNKFFE